MLAANVKTQHSGWLRKMLLCTGLCGMLCLAATAEDAVEEAQVETRGAASLISINYRRMPLSRVLRYISSASSGVNIQVRAYDSTEEEELERMLVTIELSNVTWRTALEYLAEKYRLILNTSKENNGILVLEKPERITHTYVEEDLGNVIREIIGVGGANMIISPKVDESQKVNLVFRDVPWRDALESVLKNHDCTLISEANGAILRITTLADADVNYIIKAIPLRYMQPTGNHFQAELVKGSVDGFVDRSGSGEGTAAIGSSMVSILEQIKTSGNEAKVTYETRTNTLIVRDTASKIQEMMAIIEKLDRPPEQVHIESRILTTRTDPQIKNLGIAWGGAGSDSTGIQMGVTSGPTWTTAFPFSARRSERDTGFGGFGDLGQVFGPAVGTTTGPVPMSKDNPMTAVAGNYTLGTMSMANLTAALQMSQYDENVNIVQAPSILALNNEEASIYIGTVRRYAFPALVTDPVTGAVSSSVNFEDILVGTQLFVIPHVCRDTDHIIIEVIPREAEAPTIANGNLSGSTYSYPSSWATKVVHTKMMLRSGETGVIGGLYKDEKKVQNTKVPFLGDIPGLGWAFKNRVTTKARSETFILITPKIIPTAHGDNFEQDVDDVRDAAAGLGVASIDAEALK